MNSGPNMEKEEVSFVRKHTKKLREVQHNEGINTKSDQEINLKNQFKVSTVIKKRKADQTNEEDTTKKKKKKKSKTISEVTTGCEEKSADNSFDITGVEKKKKKKKQPSDIMDSTNRFVVEGDSSNMEQTTIIKDSETSRPSLGTLILELLKDPSFSTLEGQVCSKTLKAVEEMGFTKMTAIQTKTIPPLLEGRDLVASAKTGSGKTLAFLIPAIELIYKFKFIPMNGVGCIIISPTRELSMQTFGVLEKLMTYHDHTFGLLMGGTERKTEAQYLSKGINIIVATPGRLLDHLQNTPNFLYKNLQCLIIDEADLLLKIGFEEDMKRIINLLPKTRQTMLFSATNTSKIEALTRLALKKKPLYIGVDDKTEQATVEGLKQAYLTCPSEMRFLVLHTFLKKNGGTNKVMVFFSSCSSVQFHHDLFKFIDINCICIHGRQTQEKRTSIFFEFCKASKGILLCTDVAARGLDIPNVDWIVQYDPPDDPKEYIHRVGRTARGQGGSGYALLFLRPEESGFIRYLSEARVPLTEFKCSVELFNVQQELEKLVKNNEQLKKSAKKAFEDYMRAYDCHQQKIIFNVKTLDLTKVAKSFGLTVSPVTDLEELNINTSQIRKKKNNQQRRLRRLRQQAAQSVQH